MAHRFLILHGLFGSGPDHWQHWLAERLAERGEDVVFPDLPDPDLPQLQPWLDALAELQPGGDDVVICHSLACLLWLHHRATAAPPAGRVLLVAPPSDDAGVREIDPFFPAPELHPALVPEARLVCADDDPYCPRGAATVYGEPLGVPVDLLPGRGHLNPEAGLGPWPAVERWALGERISLG